MIWNWCRVSLAFMVGCAPMAMAAEGVGLRETQYGRFYDQQLVASRLLVLDEELTHRLNAVGSREKWTPLFGQLSGQAKVDSRFMILGRFRLRCRGAQRRWQRTSQI